jgi:hypothetical protein
VWWWQQHVFIVNDVLDLGGIDDGGGGNGIGCRIADVERRFSGYVCTTG